MKKALAVILCFVSVSLSAQTTPAKLYGTWILGKITYKDGTPLPDENSFKHAFLKYRFASPDKAYIAIDYDYRGEELSFDTNNGQLHFKTTDGNPVNALRIEAFTDTLVLLQGGRKGYEDPQSMKYFFVRQEAYQQSLRLKPDDIWSVRNTDTVYKQNPKVFAEYLGSGFMTYVYSGMSEHSNMDGRKGHLAASFIVSKNGLADSVKILEGIDGQFDKQFIKVFNKAKKSWRAATLNGKEVSVRMMLNLRYFTSEDALPAMDYSMKANDAYNEKDYQLALYYLDKALAAIPSDKENLLKRGMCWLNLGNVTAACEDWKKIKKLGGVTADALLEKYAK